MQTPAYRLVLERARREERLHEGLRGGRVGPQGQRVERREKAEAKRLSAGATLFISPCYRARGSIDKDHAKRCRVHAPCGASVCATEHEAAFMLP